MVCAGRAWLPPMIVGRNSCPAVAAVVSIASGAAPPIYMLPGAVGLGAAVIGYAVVTAVVIGAREELT